MAFDHNPFDDIGTPAPGESVGLRSQARIAEALTSALVNGRQGIYLLGAEVAGAGKSTVLQAAAAEMDALVIRVEPDRRALDSTIAPSDYLRHYAEWN